MSFRFVTIVFAFGFLLSCSNTSDIALLELQKTQINVPSERSGPTPRSLDTTTPQPIVTPVPTRTPEPDCLIDIPTRMGLGQLVMTLSDPSGFSLVRDLATGNEIGMVGILGEPVEEDLLYLLEVNSASHIPFLIASDEEGGRVQRLKHKLGRLPSAAALSLLPLPEIEKMFMEYGKNLVDLGITIALAPVLDVGQGPGIGDRSFSNDPQSVIRNAGAVISGYEKAGILPVLKHFPGHGNASQDSHLGMAITPDIEEMRQIDLLPFDMLLEDRMAVMVGHLWVPGLTGELPASLSSAAVKDLLRVQMGFDGLVMTDSLGMAAIEERWPVLEATLMAINAGVDIVMVPDPKQVPSLLDGMEASLVSGQLKVDAVQESIERILKFKGVDACTLIASLGGGIN